MPPAHTYRSFRLSLDPVIRVAHAVSAAPPGHCSICGYDLRPTPDITLCPECGYPDARLAYTLRTRAVVAWANHLARRHRQTEIQPEHILVALEPAPDALACHALRALGADPAAIGASLRSNWPRPTRWLFVPRKLPLGHRTLSMVGRAVEESRAMAHRWIGTEHLLLAMIDPSSGPAADALAQAGITIAPARETVRALISSNVPDGIDTPH